VNDIEHVARLAVVSDADAAGLVSPSTRAHLADRIAAMTDEPSEPAARTRRRARRRWLVGAPLAAGLAVGVLVVTSLGGPGAKVGPLPFGPAKAEALTFTRHGHYINVIVRNPVADPKRYRAEFKAHGLNISLKMIPVSPSLVGTVVYSGSSNAGHDFAQIKVITAKGRCFTGGAGNECPVGLRVPIGFRGDAQLAFGRAARRGERYESTTSATAPGEVLHGLRISGKRVSAVLKMIAMRHVAVAEFHITTAQGIGKLVPRSEVPPSWYVYSADPWAPGQVMLSVGKTRRQPAESPPQPGAPVPSPTASAG
jgi:hypothetical protein